MVATLRWNVHDVMDIHRSLLEPGEDPERVD